MATYVGYQNGTSVMMEAANCGSDAYRLILSNTAPNVSTNTNYASATEIANGNGYSNTGVVGTTGVAVSITSHVQTAGVYKLVLAAPASPTWTASGAGFTFRYVILVNATQNALISYWDYGSAVVMNGANGDTFTPTLDPTNGTFTITTP